MKKFLVILNVVSLCFTSFISSEECGYIFDDELRLSTNIDTLDESEGENGITTFIVDRNVTGD